MKIRRFGLAALLMAIAMLLAACAGEPAGTDAGDSEDDNGTENGTDDSAGADALTVVATEFSFDPSDITVPAGTPVAVTLDNQGVIEHDFTLEEADVLIHADPGTSTTEEITLDAGTYTLYCSIPGHRESGMEGTVTAE
jgi:uncharacterized cupredoxin-like copper-binding protein